MGGVRAEGQQADGYPCGGGRWPLYWNLPVVVLFAFIHRRREQESGPQANARATFGKPSWWLPLVVGVSRGSEPSSARGVAVDGMARDLKVDMCSSILNKHTCPTCISLAVFQCEV